MIDRRDPRLVKEQYIQFVALPLNWRQVKFAPLVEN